ncbi:ATP-binding protein [Streptomyces adonidis]|uniref:ATP-binding protein n=1 Tax=Streptomyces adonidis TaxID=3231367 RepID=UPI003F68A9ED
MDPSNGDVNGYVRTSQQKARSCSRCARRTHRPDSSSIPRLLPAPPCTSAWARTARAASAPRPPCPRGPSVAVVEVADSGPGLGRHDAAHVFERFYRADPSRSRVHGGSGLGLAIAAPPSPRGTTAASNSTRPRATAASSVSSCRTCPPSGGPAVPEKRRGLLGSA